MVLTAAGQLLLDRTTGLVRQIPAVPYNRYAFQTRFDAAFPSRHTADREQTDENSEPSKLNTPGPLAQMATISECRYRWLRVPDLNPPFDKFANLGGRSQKIPQICVMRGKAVGVSRYKKYDDLEIERSMRSPGWSWRRRLPAASGRNGRAASCRCTRAGTGRACAGLARPVRRRCRTRRAARVA